jgi:hypothetical protein
MANGVAALVVLIANSRSTNLAAIAGRTGTISRGKTALVASWIANAHVTNQRCGGNGAMSIQCRAGVSRIVGHGNAAGELGHTCVEVFVAPCSAKAIAVEVTSASGFTSSIDAASP